MAILNFPDTTGQPIDGSFTYQDNGILYIWDGYKWTADAGSSGGNGSHTDGPTPPTTGEVADQWYNTDDGRLYTYTEDSSGTLVWIDASPDSIAGDGGGGGSTTPVPLKVAYLKDEKPSGTYGGSAVAGWQDRTLNTKEDANNLVVLSGNEFTLSAGEYQIEWSAPAYGTNGHQTKLTNVTSGTTQEPGSSEYINVSGGLTQTRSFGSTRVKITSDTTYKIEHHCDQAQATNGLGIYTTSSEPSVYTQVTITDLAIVGGGGSGGGTVVNYNGASAWASVTGTGTLINGLNVATTERVGISGGIYKATFVTPLPDSNYAVSGSSTDGAKTTLVVTSRTSTGFEYEFATPSSTGISAHSFTVHATNALPPKGGTGTDAWAIVNTEGQPISAGTVYTIAGGFNIAEVKKGNAAGTYDVTFVSPMPSANYAVTGSCSAVGSFVNSYLYDQTTTGFTIKCRTADGLIDTATLSFQVNATNATLPSTITQEDADLILDTIKGAGVAQKVAILVDEKPSGTGGGASVVGWQDRTLNTIVSDEGNLVTLANNKEFTLKAGTYLIEWSAPGYWTNTHRTKLTNVTNGTTQELGSSEYTSNEAGFPQTRSFGSTRVKITTDTTYKIEHYINLATALNGLGVAGTTGDPEVFTEVTITDLGVLAAGGDGGGGGSGDTIINYNGASAWGRVDSDGTLNGGLNIASVTKTGTGTYDVTFVTALPNDDYSLVGSIARDSGADCRFHNQLATGFSVTMTSYSSTPENQPFSFTVFATNSLPPKGGTGTDAWASVNADGSTNGTFNCTISRTKSPEGNVYPETGGYYYVIFNTPMPTANYSVTTSIAEDTWGLTQSIYNKTPAGFWVDIRNTESGLRGDYAFDFQVNATNATLPDTFTAEQIQSVLDFITTGGTAGIAKAWGSCEGDGTLNAGLNIASVVRTSQATYEITFSTPMPTTDYALTFGGETVQIREKTRTTTGFTMDTYDGSTTPYEGRFSFTVHAN